MLQLKSCCKLMSCQCNPLPAFISTHRILFILISNWNNAVWICFWNNLSYTVSIIFDLICYGNNLLYNVSIYEKAFFYILSIFGLVWVVLSTAATSFTVKYIIFLCFVNVHCSLTWQGNCIFIFWAFLVYIFLVKIITEWKSRFSWMGPAGGCIFRALGIVGLLVGGGAGAGPALLVASLCSVLVCWCAVCSVLVASLCSRRRRTPDCLVPPLWDRCGQEYTNTKYTNTQIQTQIRYIT